MDTKEVLIIARNFPPMGGVGTRRWSKFAKYLAAKDYNVNVLTIEYKYNDIVNWNKDVQHPKIEIHRTRGRYPQWLLRHDKMSFFVKKISEVFKVLLKVAGNWMDNAQGWEQTMLPYARSLIREKKIKNVFVTAGPYSVIYMASFLKIENPDINLIVDIRDSWNDDRWFEYKTIIKRFKNKEESVRMEMQTMQVADKIIFTTDEITNRNKEVHKLNAHKMVTITNGFDYEDCSSSCVSDESEFKLVYVGSLFSGATKALELLIEAILASKDEFIIENISIDVFGRIPADYKNPDPNFCALKGLVSVESVPNIISNSFAGLSLLAPEGAYNYSTKVFDYMSLNKNILHISNGGSLYKILENKGQYVSNYNIENLVKVLLTMKEDFIYQRIKKTDYKDYDLRNLTEKLEELML